MSENPSLPAATLIGGIENDRDEEIFLAMQNTLLDSQHFEMLVLDRLKLFCKTTVDEKFVEKLLYDLKLNFGDTNVYHFDDPQAQFGECIKFSFKSVKNSRRKMEDRHVIVPDLRLVCGDKLKNIFRKPASYFAVFDGHGGKECSSYAAIHLLGNIVDCILNEYENSRQVDKDTVCSAIRNGFLRCDKFLNKKCEREAECAKIVERGGMIFNILGANRVNGVLNITRCLGDQFMKPPLSAEPEIQTWRLDSRCKALLVASDGLFDGIPPPCCASTVKECVDNGNLGNAANVLVNKAKSGASTDNITTILVHFD
uniref:PPM-type phosphatase domain-containing protein n=1 Tax=Romanomermis culicivorax TaxID=13658 RepID=A0A915K9R0_ROMCU